MLAELIKKAKAALPAGTLLTDEEECVRYGSDWTKTPGRAGVVARPKSTEEVVTLLRLCSELGVPVVPSGGRTGLAGGAVANGEVVLSLDRMNRLHGIDPYGLTLRVQAGVTTQQVHEHCEPYGLIWPIDLASKGSCHIGGNLSTNAGGLRVIRYGMSRKWVIGLQAVTMAGEVLELNNDLEKNNTGYDLVQLLVGSEGTLAVITEATLKLRRAPGNSIVLFFPFPDTEAILRLFAEARKGPFEILAFEFFSKACLDVVTKKLGRHSKLGNSAPFYALTEVELSSDPAAIARVEEWLATMLERGVVSDGLVAKSDSEQAQVWGLREGITESIQATAPVRKYDVSVPVRRMSSFLKASEKALADGNYAIDLYFFGHLGDGSPHFNLVKPQSATMEKYLADCTAFEKVLFPLLRDHGGSISAEHGVGCLKKHWLEYSRSPEELRLFRAIKQAFDPRGLLNPGKVL